jgi:hypothetical protein
MRQFGERVVKATIEPLFHLFARISSIRQRPLSDQAYSAATNDEGYSKLPTGFWPAQTDFQVECAAPKFDARNRNGVQPQVRISKTFQCFSRDLFAPCSRRAPYCTVARARKNRRKDNARGAAANWVIRLRTRRPIKSGNSRRLCDVRCPSGSALFDKGAYRPALHRIGAGIMLAIGGPLARRQPH